MSEAPGVAAKVRRYMLDAAEAKLNARTERDLVVALQEMHAYWRVLEALWAAGETSVEVAPHWSQYHSDKRPLDEIIRFTGKHDARRLGFDIEIEEKL